MSKAKKAGSNWSAADVRRLKAYAGKGVSSRVAAEKLGRAPGATRFKAMVEGISFRSVTRAA